MPRYKVVEIRSQYSGVIIEAENENDARSYQGIIYDEAETDTWGERLVLCEEVDPDCEEVDFS